MCSMSVVFDFNTSLSDNVPDSPKLLSVDVKRMEKSELIDGCLLCVFFLLSSQSR